MLGNGCLSLTWTTRRRKRKHLSKLRASLERMSLSGSSQSFQVGRSKLSASQARSGGVRRTLRVCAPSTLMSHDPVFNGIAAVCITHGSTISLFHRLRSQIASTKYLCVSGSGSSFKGSDGALLMGIDQRTWSSTPSFIAKTSSWGKHLFMAFQGSF